MRIVSAASGSTVTRQVAFALANAGTSHDPSLASRALMYAEAIDDGDEPDALFRFGPKLQVCLDALGIAVPFLPFPRTARPVMSLEMARAA